MKSFSHDMFRLTKIRSGRRVSLYKQWQPHMAAHSMTAALAYLERALAHDRRTKELENRWRASTKRRYSVDMPVVDGLVDGLLFAIVKFVDAVTTGLPPSDPLVVQARELEQELFPAGVRAITSLPYVEQAVAVEGIVAKLQGALAGHVSDLGLEALARRLVDAVAEYRAIVDAGSGHVLYAEVETCHRRGLDYLAQLLCMIVAQFHDSDNPDHVAALETYFALLMEHDSQARADWRARRARAATPGDEVPGLPEDEDDLPADDDILDDDVPVVETP